MQGVHVDPVARVARVEAGVRWRQVIDAAAPTGWPRCPGRPRASASSATRSGGGMGHLARRHGFAADHVRAIELVTAAGEVTTVTAAERPGAVLGPAGRPGQLRDRLRPRVRPGPGAPVLRRGAVLRRRTTSKTVLHAFASVGADAAGGGRPPRSRCCGCRRSTTCRRRCAAVGQPGPALRLHRLGPSKGAALLAPMRASRPQCSTRSARCRTPRSTASTWTRPSRCRRSPAGAAARGLPDDLLDALLAVAGPDVDVPLAVVELRLMGGALGRPAAIPNAVAGRDGAFALTVVAPAPPPLAAVAPVVDRAGGRGRGALVDRNVAGQLPATVSPREPVGARGPRAAASGQGGGRPPGRLRRPGLRVRAGRGGCAMSRPVVVVEPGQGDRVGNVEFLARTVDTPYFNLGIVRLEPGQGVDGHRHTGEDDSWLVLDGTLSVTVGDERRVRARRTRHLRAGPRRAPTTRSPTRASRTSGSSTSTRRGLRPAIGWRPRWP